MFLLSLDLTVIILTFNEEIHIERAVKSVKNIAKNIFIVDSYSTDNTLKIAKENGAEIFQNKFVNQAKQFQWAIDNLDITTKWVMRLDADEIIEDSLSNSLIKELPKLSDHVTGINFDRKHIFMGKWIKHGGRYPLTMLRMWRHGYAYVEDRWMDEHIVVSSGKTIRMRGGFSDHNLNDLSYFIDKHNKYATREAVEVILKSFNGHKFINEINKKNSSFNASYKRYIKEKIYNRLPFGFGPLLYFLYRYFIMLGFLDGKSGFIYHFLQGLWYRFLVNAKVNEFTHSLKNLKSIDEKIKKLSMLSGFKLDKK
jgi:glycosyltransferase involved in cell wall biosynthesis